MIDPHVVLDDIASAVAPPEAGILSRTLHEEEGLRLVVFGFAAGEELSEHTSSKRATIQVLAGRLRVTLAGESFDVGPGAWIRMAAGLRHAVRAEEPSVMVLTLLAAPAPD